MIDCIIIQIKEWRLVFHYLFFRQPPPPSRPAQLRDLDRIGRGRGNVPHDDAGCAARGGCAVAARLRRGRVAEVVGRLGLVAAGQDQVVSTPAIGQFAVRLRAGSHLVIPGARHEILMEQDRYREQFWAAFDAFVPGTPMY